MRPKKTPKQAIDIDDEEAIDFSTVKKEAVVRHTLPSALLQSRVTDVLHQQQQHEVPVTLCAVDPRLNAYTHRAPPRRRIGFGGGGSSYTKAPTPAAENAASVPVAKTGEASVKNDLLDAFWREDAKQQELESQTSRREAHEKEIHALWSGSIVEAPSPTVSASTTAPRTNAANVEKDVPTHYTYSLLDQFFFDGVPDVEPWDLWALSMPRYTAENIAVCVADRVHHPVLQETHYSQRYLHQADEKPVVVKLVKTREELRAERRERLRKAKEDRDRAKRAEQRQQQVKSEGVNGDNNSHSPAGGTFVVSTNDRLTNSNLRYNLFSDSVLNPLSTENKVFSQYQERFLEHQRRNHERHVAAIPHQIEKRGRDLKRHAEESPVFRAYRIYPIYSPAHLGKLRNFANDCLLRGFLLWVGKCDAFVILTGGEVAVRHLERWMLEKMRWESTETNSVRIMTCPLQDAATFSFVAPKNSKRRRQTTKEEGSSGGGDGNGETEREHVYMKFVDSVHEGECFMRTVPTDGPWRDLLHVWRAALAAAAAEHRGAG